MLGACKITSICEWVAMDGQLITVMVHRESNNSSINKQVTDAEHESNYIFKKKIIKLE